MKVIYGNAVFSSTARRNRVVNKWNSVASGAGFQPTDVLPGYGPGITSYERVATKGDSPDMIPGQMYSCFHMAFTHTDEAKIDQAHTAVLDEMNANGWIHGDFGTWSDGATT